MTAMIVTQERITLLNASYEVLSANVTLQKAARLLARDKVEIQEWIEGQFLGPWKRPVVLRLKHYVKIAYDKLHGPPRVSKRGVLLRDGRKCAYCGKHATSIDHVHPRSQGGKNTWQNLVAACIPCNHRKRDRTPEQAGMTLLWKGFVPTRVQLSQGG